MYPLISIILPIRNEAAFIDSCLRAILEQDYPGKIEILVADGMSTDGTREILQASCEERSNLHLIDNPQKIVSTGLNLALSKAQGEIIIRVDGHSIIATNFVRENVALLAEHPEAWSVGGPIVHVAETYLGKAIAVAMSHPLGVGNAFHRFGHYEGFVEGAQFPAIRRWVFERVGEFDEHLIRNQDDEFNYRMSKAGGKVFVSPRIQYIYYVRENLKGLFKQYLQYGFWRIPVIRKHHQPTTIRQLVPSLFYFVIFILMLVGLVLKNLIVAFGLPVIYSVILVAGGLALLPRVGFQIACRVPVAIGIMHAGYAFGFLYGLWAILFKPTAWDVSSSMATLSR